MLFVLLPSLSTFYDCPPPQCRPSTQFVKCLLFSIRRLFMILFPSLWRLFLAFSSWFGFSCFLLCHPAKGESLCWSLSSVWIKFLSFPFEEFFFCFCTKNFESCQRVRRKVSSCHKKWRFLAFFTHWVVSVGSFLIFSCNGIILRILCFDIVVAVFKEVEMKNLLTNMFILLWGWMWENFWVMRG